MVVLEEEESCRRREYLHARGGELSSNGGTHPSGVIGTQHNSVVIESHRNQEVKDMYKGCIVDCRMDGSCTDAIEVIVGAGDMSVNASRCILRDHSPRSPLLDGIKFERGQSIVNPLYARKVYSRCRKSRECNPIPDLIPSNDLEPN